MGADAPPTVGAGASADAGADAGLAADAIAGADAGLGMGADAPPTVGAGAGAGASADAGADAGLAADAIAGADAGPAAGAGSAADTPPAAGADAGLAADAIAGADAGAGLGVDASASGAATGFGAEGQVDEPASTLGTASVGGRAAAGNVRYVGALLEPAGADAGWTSPEPGERPRVVVSLGTTPMDEAPVLQRLLIALADLPVDVVATVGDHFDASELAATAPANATVTGYVRHAALLPGAALLVTHAGLGTVLAGLAHGVPMLCLPLGREQPDNAAAIARLGAGRVLPPDTSVDDLRAALTEMLGAPALRTAAAAAAAAMSKHTGLAEAELEALVDSTS
jgi:hypothetical protein